VGRRTELLRALHIPFDLTLTALTTDRAQHLSALPFLPEEGGRRLWCTNISFSFTVAAGRGRETAVVHYPFVVVVVYVCLPGLESVGGPVAQSLPKRVPVCLHLLKCLKHVRLEHFQLRISGSRSTLQSA